MNTLWARLNVLACIAGLLPSPATAALPPGAVEELLAAAPIRVQLDVTNVEIPAFSHEAADCRLSGVVTSVLRGDLAPGDTIAIAVPCFHAGAELPVGGTIYRDIESLTTLEQVEAILVPAGPVFTIAGYGAGLTVLEDAVPFFGTWKCGGNVFSFGPKHFDNGDEAIKITHIQQTPAGYRLHLSDNATVIELSAIGPESMRYASPHRLDCERLSADSAQ